MIDDLSFTGICYNGKLMARNDWGYGLDGCNSLYAYMTKHLLSIFPEIKGTFFLPLCQQHAVQNKFSGYDIRFLEEPEEQKDFLHRIINRFEVAFHGTTHGRYKDLHNSSIADNWEQEFSYLTISDVEYLKRFILNWEEFYGIKLLGGKYPGYIFNQQSKDIVKQLGFKWWSSSIDMIDKKCDRNKNSYWIEGGIFEIPTNLSGSALQYYIDKPFILAIKSSFHSFKIERYIRYLYQHRYIISIQEHFMNLRTDGKRQEPNIYDDILSLQKIYGLLKPLDIWYATCSEIAHYRDSYDHSNLVRVSENRWRLTYRGIWSSLFLSLKSRDIREIREIKTGKRFHGIYHQGRWVFNDVLEGEYEITDKG